MAGYVIGAVFLLFAGWRLWTDRVPSGALRFSGTVVEELKRKSPTTGRRDHTYAPKVSYQHPKTGASEVYEPSRFGQERFETGSRTELIYDPEKDRIYRAAERPIRDTIVLVAVGLGLMVAQYFSG